MCKPGSYCYDGQCLRKSIDTQCCKALTAECLACEHGVTVEKYCYKYPKVQGCGGDVEPVPKEQYSVSFDIKFEYKGTEEEAVNDIKAVMVKMFDVDFKDVTVTLNKRRLLTSDGSVAAKAEVTINVKDENMADNVATAVSEDGFAAAVSESAK